MYLYSFQIKGDSNKKNKVIAGTAKSYFGTCDNTDNIIWQSTLLLLLMGPVQSSKLKNLSPWPQAPSELYWLSDSRLWAKLVPNFSDRGCHVVSVTNLYGRILVFLDRSRYSFFQVAPQLYSRGWVDPVPDPLLVRKSGSAGNRTRTSGSVARNSDH
jgi:hypothetical protein